MIDPVSFMTGMVVVTPVFALATYVFYGWFMIDVRYERSLRAAAYRDRDKAVIAAADLRERIAEAKLWLDDEDEDKPGA